MEKEKKLIAGHLTGRSVIYVLLTTIALVLIVYLAQYTVYHLDILRALSGSEASFIQAMLLPYIIFSFLAALFVSSLAWRKGKILWHQWQRQWALDAEEERVSRLVDNSAEDDAEQAESSEMIQQNKL
jgi:hypothetical protein